MSNLAQRVLVALVGIPIVGYIVLYRPLGLIGLSIICALLCAHEFYGLAKAKGFAAQVYIGMTATALIVLSFAQYRLGAKLAFFHHLSSSEFLACVLILATIATFTSELFRGHPNPLNHVSLTIGGFLYAGIGLGSFCGIREYFLLQQAGGNPHALVMPGEFLLTLLASIWICDSGAYFGGRAMGKHKLFERVSPNKTWEGAIWGFIFALVAWFVARAYVPGLEEVSIATCIAMGLIVGVFGQIGDLAESLLKRDAGVKDSSALIPGHGGMLDRLDSLLFVAPLAYLYLELVGN